MKQHEDGIVSAADVISDRLADEISSVCDELKRAGVKFPGWPDDPVHAAAIVAEEAGELIRAALKDTYECGKKGNMREEAVQTAAMALRFLVNLPLEEE